MKNTRLLLVMSLALSCSLARAQRQSEGRGFFTISWEQSNLDKLNASLADYGYGALSNQFYGMGGLGYGVVKNFILGGEGYALWGNKTDSKGYHLTASGGYGLFNFGVLVHHKKLCNIYPYCGVGGGALSLKIMETGTPSFEEVLANPNRGSQLSIAGFMVSIGIGMDKIIIMKKEKNAEGGMALGLRIGYQFTPIKGDWVFDEELTSGGPSLGIQGPFVRLLIGGGGIRQEE